MPPQSFTAPTLACRPPSAARRCLGSSWGRGRCCTAVGHKGTEEGSGRRALCWVCWVAGIGAQTQPAVCCATPCNKRELHFLLTSQYGSMAGQHAAMRAWAFVCCGRLLAAWRAGRPGACYMHATAYKCSWPIRASAVRNGWQRGRRVRCTRRDGGAGRERQAGKPGAASDGGRGGRVHTNSTP